MYVCTYVRMYVCILNFVRSCFQELGFLEVFAD